MAASSMPGNVLAVLGVLAICFHFHLTTANAQSDPLKVHQTLVKGIEVRRQTQQNEDEWAETKTELLARYQALQAEEKRLQNTKIT